MSLFDDIMNRDWDAVVEKYRGEDRKMKISASGDTTMHLAARFGKEQHIKEMLARIGEDEAFEILSVKNERGNTPLHVAARLGDPLICCCIATKDSRLLSLPNRMGATPLYVSAATGNRQAFFSLDFLARESRCEINYSLYRMSNGCTILHAAVFQEYFGLAIQIVETYPDLVNFVDNSGYSPLHILAGKEKAFPRSALLDFLDRTILPYLNIEQLVEKELEKPAVISHEFRTRPPLGFDHQVKRIYVRKTRNYRPESYQRRNNDLRPRQIGNLKNICGTLLWIMGAGINGVWHAGLLIVKMLLNIAGIRWLNICHLIRHVLQKRNDLRAKKLRWRLSLILLEELVNHSSMYLNDPNHLQHGGQASNHKANDESKEKGDESWKVVSPFLIAARIGVAEVADAILNKFPVAAFDLDSEDKNAVLLACERKRAGFFIFMLDKYPKEMNRMLLQQDKQGNSALHLAAKFEHQMIAYTPEPASYLRAEYSWYKRVEKIMLPKFATLQNESGTNPGNMFMKTHGELIKSGSEWLLKTSESCSVVAALIATVAFATSAVDTPDSSKVGMFLGVSLFDLYCFFGLLALCFAILSLLYFLALRTSSFRVIDFADDLPMKLFLGLMTLLLSMVCILASFCFKHYSMLENETMRRIAIPIYVVTSIRVLSLATSQLPFYHGVFFYSKFREPI